jgi:hypothetical protein
MNIESLYNHFKQDITHIHDLKMQLMNPSSFKEFIEEIKDKFNHQLSIVIQYYLKQNNSKDSNLQFNKELININNISNSLKESEKMLYSQSEKANQLINLVNSDINKLRETIKELTGYSPTEISQLNQSSFESVTQYTTLYSNKLYIFFITIIITIICMYFYIHNRHELLQCFLFIIIYYFIEYIYYHFITLIFLPQGVTNVDLITDLCGNAIAPLPYSPSDYCMGSQCCYTTNTHWIEGQGCVAL